MHVDQEVLDSQVGNAPDKIFVIHHGLEDLLGDRLTALEVQIVYPLKQLQVLGEKRFVVIVEHAHLLIEDLVESLLVVAIADELVNIVQVIEDEVVQIEFLLVQLQVELALHILHHLDVEYLRKQLHQLRGQLLVHVTLVEQLKQKQDASVVLKNLRQLVFVVVDCALNILDDVLREHLEDSLVVLQATLHIDVRDDSCEPLIYYRGIFIHHEQVKYLVKSSKDGPERVLHVDLCLLTTGPQEVLIGEECHACV